MLRRNKGEGGRPSPLSFQLAGADAAVEEKEGDRRRAAGVAAQQGTRVRDAAGDGVAEIHEGQSDGVLGR